NRDDMSHFIGMSSDMMLSMDGGGEIAKASPAFYELLGLEGEEARDQPFPMLFSDTDRPLVRRTLQALSLQDSLQS
ncbi:MAG TPA: PAS domain-containing protein, partial [Alphaproteobacteria bacterium]|nr:PAS domain-containing protein [Alphaproteobacteria bacterium]